MHKHSTNLSYIYARININSDLSNFGRHVEKIFILNLVFIGCKEVLAIFKIIHWYLYKSSMRLLFKMAISLKRILPTQVQTSIFTKSEGHQPSFPHKIPSFIIRL